MENLQKLIPDLKGRTFGHYEIEFSDDFSDTDPVDKSISQHQGIRLVFTDGSLIVFRLSGIGIHGATLRVYLESYEPDVAKQSSRTASCSQRLDGDRYEIAQIRKLTGREKPTAII